MAETPPSWSSDDDWERDEKFRLNCDAADAYAKSTAASGRLHDLVVRKWHQIMFVSVVPLGYYAGNYRQDDSSRPGLGRDVKFGGVKGSSFYDVLREMDDMITNASIQCAYLEVKWDRLEGPQRAEDLAFLIASSLGEFMKIHPFLNGNGRTSRVFWRYFLYRFGLPAMYGIPDRPAYETEYMEVMKAAVKGDPYPLMRQVLKHIREGGANPHRRSGF